MSKSFQVRLDEYVRSKGCNTDRRCPACGRVMTYLEWQADTDARTPAGCTGEGVSCGTEGCSGTMWRYEMPWFDETAKATQGKWEDQCRTEGIQN